MVADVREPPTLKAIDFTAICKIPVEVMSRGTPYMKMMELRRGGRVLAQRFTPRSMQHLFNVKRRFDGYDIAHTGWKIVQAHL